MGRVTWESGDAYEAYVGRWSRRVAELFVAWLDVSPGRRWLDVGCGTGALTAQIATAALPARLVGLDRSTGFLASARTASTRGRALPGEPRDADNPGQHQSGIPHHADNPGQHQSRMPSHADNPGQHQSRMPSHADNPGRAGALADARFCTGDAAALPLANNAFDAVVSGLALNFVSSPRAAAREFARVAAPGAVVAAYVWDYAGGMEMMRHFWTAAAEIDPASATLAESLRFDFCRDDVLAELWSAAGLHGASTHRIEIPTVFADFDDYWRPFLGGQGPAPSYVAALTGPHRDALRERLRSQLPARADGSIPLTAAAWAVKGTA